MGHSGNALAVRSTLVKVRYDGKEFEFYDMMYVLYNYISEWFIFMMNHLENYLSLIWIKLISNWWAMFYITKDKML